MNTDLSALHNRTLWLLSRTRVTEDGSKLPVDDVAHRHQNIWVDNLYVSPKLLFAADTPNQEWPQTRMAGPARTNRIPDCIRQTQMKKATKFTRKKFDNLPQFDGVKHEVVLLDDDAKAKKALC